MSRLFYGDNIDNLRRLKDETVDLCYIDPPFNSKRSYNQIYNNVGREDRAQARAFTDTWEWGDRAIEGLDAILGNMHARFPTKTIDLIKGLHRVLGEGSLLAYLVSLTTRIAEMHRLLKPTGSFYLHCDPTASHYLKLVLDSLFCSQGGEFQNEIIWRRTGAHGKTRRFGPIHDVILFYTKSGTFTWNPVSRPYMRGHVEEYFVQEDDGRWRTNYYGNVLTGSGLRGGESGKPWRGFDPSAKGRHWALPGKLIEEVDEDLSELTQHQKLDRLYELGLITITPGEAWPMYQHYIDRTDGQAMSDIWAFQPYTDGTVFGTEEGVDADVRWLAAKDAERLGYPTQKPEGLLERIVRASSNADDTVLDAYCGCGTTVSVAERLGREWIGMDITYQSIALILERLEDDFGKKVADGVKLDGVPRDMESAVALAHKKDDRVRKEFEKWAILTYTNNRGAIKEKKGADAGIDGTVHFMTGPSENALMVLQVKSGGVGRGDIAKLRGDMQREDASLGVFITLEPASAPMVKEARAAGHFRHPLMGRDYPKIEIVTIQEMIDKRRRIDLPLSVDAVKDPKAPVSGGTQPRRELPRRAVSGGMQRARRHAKRKNNVAP